MKYLPLFTIIILTLISCNEDRSQRRKAVDLIDSAYKAIENNENQSAINSAKKAIKIYTEISDTTGIIESNYLISRASALKGDFDNAILHGEKGSHLCKSIENYPLEYKINNTFLI